MPKRWISENPSPELPLVGQATVACWLRWRYYFVSTIQVGPSDSPLAKLTEAISGKPEVESYVTQVFRCDKIGFVRNMGRIFYQREYSSLQEAREGHAEVVNLLFLGRLEMYEWTRWAAPGGRGYGTAGWVAISAGLLAAIWTFHIISRWWLALPVAIVAWLVGTGLVGAIWAVVRRLIELGEGIS